MRALLPKPESPRQPARASQPAPQRQPTPASQPAPQAQPTPGRPLPSELEPLRIGILGATRIAELALVRPARVTGDRLVAVAAHSRAHAQAFAERHGIERVLDDYAALIDDDELDLVYNPLANGLLGRWNLAAARAAKHVLSEKPLASNAAEAREVRDAALAAGVTVVEGFQYVHQPVMRRMHQLLAESEIGSLRHVEAHVTMPAPPDDDPHWSYPLAGGALMDLGCYGMHAHRTFAPWAGGEPRVVAARAKELPGCPGVDEWLEAALEFPDGATGFVRCSMNDEWRVTLRLVGTAGRASAWNFVLPHQDDTIVVRTRGRERAERPGTRSAYVYQLEALRAHLRGGTPFPLDVHDAVATAELIDAAYVAAGFALRPVAGNGRHGGLRHPRAFLRTET